MTQYQNLTGTINQSQYGQRLDQALTKVFHNYSRSTIKQWIINGQVTVNGHVISMPKKKILGNEVVHIASVAKKVNFLTAQDIKLNIIYEDKYILIINKPDNLVVHPGAGNSTGTLLNALLYYFPSIATIPRAGIVHRLDKNTTGIMVVAKTITAYYRLIELLRMHSITREYEAIAHYFMTAGGVVNQPISRHPTKRTLMAVNLTGKPAITHYRVMEKFRNHTRLRLRIETGRTHQIRTHMSYIKHPLVGDHSYGGCLRHTKGLSTKLDHLIYNFNRQALHAIMLSFKHPITSVDMTWHAPLPSDMIMLIDALKDDVQ